MALFDALDVYAESEVLSAAMNMAVDEALLETSEGPALRFYQWRQPSLSFGYFGRYAEAAAEAGAREMVRRWTGGGIVLHGADLTYSLVWPKRDGHVLPPARRVYLQVHAAICAVLARSLPTSLAQRDAPKQSESCFANPVTADVLVDGRKIAGAAQRRTRAGLLHQGSIQAVELPAGFVEDFAAELCPNFRRAQFPAALLELARERAAATYGTRVWTQFR